MKEKYLSAYMDIALRISELSTATRLQVGAIIVKDDRIISLGYNGTPYGWDNNCEDLDINTGELVTKAEVLHAESNCIAKLARGNESGEGATIFITHQPCMDCAKLIYQAGIKSVWYEYPYRKTQGIEFLHRAGVDIKQFE
jgi:dCMP deaminase